MTRKVYGFGTNRKIVYSIGSFLNKGYKFIAHNACADFLWMDHHLGVIHIVNVLLTLCAVCRRAFGPKT